MTARRSIIAFTEARAKKLREKGDSGEAGWAMAKHDARILETLAADIRAEMDVACPDPAL